MPESFEKLTQSYFDYLAKSFPVMCASDEFHFLPRAAAASGYYDRMESIDGLSIEEHIFVLKEFQKKFRLIGDVEGDLEKLTDLELLNSSIAGILIELDKNRSWVHNPLLYLKIASIGIDHAFTKPADSQREVIERTLARLCAIPHLLKQARCNLGLVPETYHQAALAMLNDCETYLGEMEQAFAKEAAGRLSAAFEKARAANADFRTFLLGVPRVRDRDFAVPSFEATLRVRFGSVRNLLEIFQIAVEEWFENLKELEKIQRDIAPDKSWKELYHGCNPEEAGSIDTITLYMREVERLKRFFKSNGFSGIISQDLPLVCATPVYLQSVRGSASFSAAFTRDSREKDFFYITTQPLHRMGKKSHELLRKHLHREYKFLTAHETFPGHYLLDSTRRMLDNPVRSQIESPLFYEGWAYYVESLLTDYGYADRPIDRLIDHKRRLWRAARCQIDIGLHTGKLLQEDALKLLTTAGFNHGEAARQISHYRLNPGYQLCYSLGRFEILELRKAYGGRIGHERFHRFLLHGGQLPFHLVEKRFSLENAGA
ncbi:MAG TPA: DUF885 family protein [Syntrophobacteraceae bacterium]|nr:DUF885 family protein [Syntrophobacteraceae bacterium]